MERQHDSVGNSKENLKGQEGHPRMEWAGVTHLPGAAAGPVEVTPELEGMGSC